MEVQVPIDEGKFSGHSVLSQERGELIEKSLVELELLIVDVSEASVADRHIAIVVLSETNLQVLVGRTLLSMISISLVELEMELAFGVAEDVVLSTFIG